MKTIKNLKKVRENMGVVVLTARDTIILWSLLKATLETGKFEDDDFVERIPEKVKEFLPGINLGLDISILRNELERAVDYYKLDK